MHDGPSAQAVFSTESFHDICEGLWELLLIVALTNVYEHLKALTGSHESCSCHIWLEVELLADDLQDGHEVIVADDSQDPDEVEGDEDVHNDAAIGSLLWGEEEVPWKLLNGCLGAVGRFIRLAGLERKSKRRIRTLE